MGYGTMNRKTNIPAFLDLSPTNGINLDENVAATHFVGLSHDGAMSLIETNPILYQEDFMWMGSIGFAYYFPDLVRVVIKEGTTDSVLAQAFAVICKFRVDAILDHNLTQLALQTLDLLLKSEMEPIPKTESLRELIREARRLLKM
jgi:hypothetical protein